ncbi:unnamed protein product [Dicrocoelium dendriticum]|nr:unnamed protein product [Dicrocoelium dendriticum]
MYDVCNKESWQHRGIDTMVLKAYIFCLITCLLDVSCEFEIKIFNESHPEKTVNSLFFSVANETGVKVVTSCMTMPREANVHTCVTSYQNEQKVTWEFPENWSGPARFLKKIDYDSEAINLQIVGMYWPKQLSAINNQVLYVDIIVLVKQKYDNICEEIFKNVRPRLIPKTTCRLEFYDDSVLNPPNFVAKLNLLIPFQWEERNTMEQVHLWLANRLMRPGYQCIFPVQVRTQAPTYVPSEVDAEAMDYKFVLIFYTSILGITSQSEISKAEYCEKLTSLAIELITNCNITMMVSDYGRAIVTVPKAQASVWEVQQHLMVELNMESQNKCLVNVAIATEDKDIK